MVPRREPRLPQLQLVPLSPGRALAVLVGEDGAVENRVVELPPGVGAGALEEASNYITARLAGRTLAEARAGHAAGDRLGPDRARRRQPRPRRARAWRCGARTPRAGRC